MLGAFINERKSFTRDREALSFPVTRRGEWQFPRLDLELTLTCNGLVDYFRRSRHIFAIEPPQNILFTRSCCYHQADSDFIRPDVEGCGRPGRRRSGGTAPAGLPKEASAVEGGGALLAQVHAVLVLGG